jgi:hypothetical protein
MDDVLRVASEQERPAIRVCAWCNTTIGDDPKPAPVGLNYNVTHGICSKCEAMMETDGDAVTRASHVNPILVEVAARITHSVTRVRSLGLDVPGLGLPLSLGHALSMSHTRDRDFIARQIRPLLPADLQVWVEDDLLRGRVIVCVSWPQPTKEAST